MSDKNLIRKRKNLVVKKEEKFKTYTSYSYEDVYPFTVQGIKIKDKLYLTDYDGKEVELYEVKSGAKTFHYINDWKRKFDRFFGIDDQEFHSPTNKTDLIHAGMFIGFAIIALSLCALVAYLFQ